MDKRLERNKYNVLNLKKFLIEINQYPQAMLEEVPDLLEVLKNQGSLSRYQDQKRNIIPSSLNTLKRISDRFLENGFEEIESLRNLAIQTIHKELDKKTVSHKLNKEDLKNTIKEVNSQQDELKAIHLVLLNQIMEDLNVFNKIISCNDIGLVKDLSQKAKKRIQSLGSKTSELVILASNETRTLQLVK